jgi:putative endonuclease
MNKYEIGKSGENRGEQYLLSLGHSILYRNYRNREGEIDIISLKEVKIFFVEVKNWQSKAFHPLEAFNKKKCARMKKAATSYFVECGRRESDYYVSFCLLAIKGSEIEFYIDLF